MAFLDDEKIALSDKIYENYFNKNFGSMSKSDLETLLFSEYIEHCIRNNIPYDDYTLSKQLGITQSRIRSLKERKELKYPHEGFEWKTVFAESIKNAKYDENDHYIKVIIQDINVMSEIRHYIEEKGWYDECSLNKKLLRIPFDCFLEICSEDESFESLFSEETKDTIKELEKSEGTIGESISDFLKDFSKEGLKQFAMIASKEALLAVLSLLPFGGMAKVAIDFFVKVIKGE